MSHPVVQVSRKTKAALINHVLRAYNLVTANEPVCAAREYDYLYDHDTARFTLLGKPSDKDTKPPGDPMSNFIPFITAAQKQFENLKKVTSFKYVWDGTKFEKDHALEVQHVIKMLVDAEKLDDAGWTKATLTSVFHLGFYLNDQRNLWNIPAGLNQMKKHIPLSIWYQNRTSFADKVNAVDIATAQKDFVKEYLFAYTTRDGRTPFSELLDLSAEMSGLPETDLTWLTKAAGVEIFKLLTGWCKSVGISKWLSVKTQKLNNPEESITDLYGNEKKSLNEKRSHLAMQAEMGETLFASDVDKVGHAIFENGTKKYKVSKDDSFSGSIDQIASNSEDAALFDDSNWQ